MMRVITAVRFDKELKVGRNKPVILTCEDDAGGAIEVVAKFAHRCERGVNALIAESLSAMFAADIDLPVPEPFAVRIDPDLAAPLFTRITGRRRADPKEPAFGSRLLPPAYNVLPSGKTLSDSLKQVALEIIAFDVLVQNSDRLPENPNCLTNGQQIAIIDHELAFTTGIIGWKPPWEAGSLAYLGPPNPHLLYANVRGTLVDLERLVGAVEAVTDERLDEYLAALPEAWIGPESQETQMIEQLRSMRAHIADIVLELRGALR
jgi:hypothetical protein